MAYAPFDLTGKVALITGGNRGIGLGMAEALGQAGADLVIWGSNPERNQQAEAALKPLGVRVLTQAVDVSQEAAVAQAMAEAVEAMGRVDSVFANAGVWSQPKPFTDIATDDYRWVLSVNLDGVFFTFREACKHMVARAKAGDPGGSLVATASMAALDGAAFNEPYAATKGAAISLIKALAVEYARYGVRANAILPGWIATEMTTVPQDSEVFNDKVIGRVPLRRWGEPKDFGGVAVYLASQASAFHTGDCLVVDGGYAVF